MRVASSCCARAASGHAAAAPPSSDMNSRRPMPSMETASSPEAKAVYRKDAGGFLGQAPKAPRWGLGGQQCPLQVHGVRIVVFALVTSSLLARLIEVPQIRRRLVLFRGH